MREILEVAIAAAREAGRIQRQRVGRLGHVEYKEANDPVTEVDLLCEREIIRRIQERFPGHDILAEESGGREGVSSPHKWIIDPLDGTINYAHGFPCYAVSIAFESEGVLRAGVAYNPSLDELFVASRGEGATLNGERIRVSGIDTLDRSLLATGFAPAVVLRSLDNNIENFHRFMKVAQAVRRPGSAVMDLCYTAMGRFEGFWEMKLKPWDLAAGVLIVEEAGGRVTRFDGAPFTIYGPEVLASNGLVHQAMIDVFAAAAD